jgi:hypothetical protein
MAIFELYALITNTELIFQSIVTEWFIGIIVFIYLLNSDNIKEGRKSIITVINKLLHIKNIKGGLEKQK